LPDYEGLSQKPSPVVIASFYFRRQTKETDENVDSLLFKPIANCLIASGCAFAMTEQYTDATEPYRRRGLIVCSPRRQGVQNP
jgi:hypothetical protein